MKAIASVVLKGLTKTFKNRVVQATLVAFVGGFFSVIGKEVGKNIVNKFRKNKGVAVSDKGTAGNFLSKLGKDLVDSLRGKTKLKLIYDEEKHPGVVYVANLDTSDFGFEQGVLSLPFKIENAETPNILTYVGKFGKTGSKWRLDEKELVCLDATPGNASPIKEGTILGRDEIELIINDTASKTADSIMDVLAAAEPNV
jgi:hypothetical protein